MSRIAAIGERERVRGFAFAGVRVSPADDPQSVRAAWQALPQDVALLILTPAARSALRSELEASEQLLCAVMAP